MPAPGDPAGDCPRCDGPRVQVGYDSSTLGAYCERCDLLVALCRDALTLGEATEHDFDDEDPPSEHAWGPDPMP